MAPRCDRCRVRALTWWSMTSRDDLDLFLCGHHSDALAEALVAADWMQVADERDAPVVVAI